MNIYERILKDHERHRDLAERLAATSGDSEERRKLWSQFKPDCVAHANAEEQTFYAAMITEPEGQQEARHGVHEHKEIDDLLEELDELDMGSGGWLQKFGKLKHLLEHHMEEEEGEIFAQAKSMFDAKDARQLAGEFEEAKRAEL